jgi:hypothetical protein
VPEGWHPLLHDVMTICQSLQSTQLWCVHITSGTTSQVGTRYAGYYKELVNCLFECAVDRQVNPSQQHPT